MPDAEADWMDAMRRGDLARAWSINDAVLAARDPAGRDDPALPYHRRWVWDGRPFRGRPVLVRCYHGLGDTLQYARFLPALRAQAASVTVELQPALLPLLQGAADHLIPFDTAAPAPPAPCDIEIMELSHALRLPPGAAPPPYVQARPAPAPAGAIGLCWQAGGWDPARAVPAALLRPLAALRPAYALQPDTAGLAVLNPEGTGDLASTAARIAGLALVITVDTMVAHLAGALGRPVWLLLKHAADWRWMQGGRTAWYPTARLFRQPAPGDWAPVLAAVAARLGAGVTDGD